MPNELSEGAAATPDVERAKPTDPSERIIALDALRGFALLGILVINIWLFASVDETGPLNAYGSVASSRLWDF